ncbi:MAG TPA: PaaI family thioesterase [Burkholderiaceae bacterium]|nr:PaaI family thioesterase [Burkholderiaceae bacterium]
MNIDAEALARLNDNPLYRVIGIQLHEAIDGQARSTLTPDPQVCWPSAGQPHGGILFTVMDTTMAFAVMSVAEPDRGCATVDCSIQYPAPARHGPFVCTAVAAKKAGRTVFVRGDIMDAHGTVVAFGQATFRIIAPKH